MYISVWVIAALVIFFLYFVEGRFKRIEKHINISNRPSDVDLSQPVSYEVEVIVEPDWLEVIKWCFPNLKIWKEVNKFAEELFDDKDLKLDKEKSLFNKSAFVFTEFYDAVSGLNPIWSYHYKSFIDEVRVLGWVFAPSDEFGKSIWDKFPSNRIRRLMSISPAGIGFRSDLPDGAMLDEDFVGQFPYSRVISFFADVERYSGAIWGGNLMIKKFPKDLQELFEKHHVVYDPWNYEDYGTGIEAKQDLVKSEWLEAKGVEMYDQKMKSHTFKMPTYTVTIRMRFFQV